MSISGFSFTSTTGIYDTWSNWASYNGANDPGVIPYSYAAIILGSNTQQMDATEGDTFGTLYATGLVAGGTSNTIDVTGTFAGNIAQFTDYTLLIASGGTVNAPVVSMASSSIVDYGSLAISYGGLVASGSAITIENTGIFTDGQAITLSGSSLTVDSGGKFNVTGTGTNIATAGARISLQSETSTTLAGALDIGNATLDEDTGATLQVDAIALSSGAVLNLDGYTTLINGGGISGNGGTVSIGAGATVAANEISFGSTNTLIVNGMLDLVSNGGQAAAGTNIINAGGVVNFNGGEDSAGDTWNINGGTFVSTHSFENGNFVFSGTGGVLDLSNDSLTNNKITITGFNSSDALILGPISGTSAVTATIVNGNTLELIQNNAVVSVIDHFTLAPGQTLSSNAGTIVNGQYVVNHCFYPGTMIATTDGEIAVEDIVPGTLVKTVSGKILPVRWVGWSQVATRFADPLKSLPIRIRAGALAENLPARDLLLSPDHAVCIDGVLVQAGALVNGVSIRRETAVPDSFRYYHIELATHELLLAENCPAESFVDNVDRMYFHNWDEREAPRDMVPELDMPRAKSVRQVPSGLRATLAERMALFPVSDAA